MTDKMDFVRNWVEEVRALASKWNSDEHSSSTGDALEFQAYSSLLCLVWDEVYGVNKASSMEIFSYISEMKKWISSVQVQQNSVEETWRVLENSAPFVGVQEPVKELATDIVVVQEPVLPSSVHKMTQDFKASEVELSAPVLPWRHLAMMTQAQSMAQNVEDAISTKISSMEENLKSMIEAKSTTNSSHSILDPIRITGHQNSKQLNQFSTSKATVTVISSCDPLNFVAKCAKLRTLVVDSPIFAAIGLVVLELRPMLSNFNNQSEQQGFCLGICCEHSIKALEYGSAHQVFDIMSIWRGEATACLCDFVLSSFMIDSVASCVGLAWKFAFDPGICSECLLLWLSAVGLCNAKRVNLPSGTMVSFVFDLGGYDIEFVIVSSTPFERDLLAYFWTI